MDILRKYDPVKNATLAAFSYECPPIIDSERLNLNPLCDGYPFMFMPTYEYKTVFHRRWPDKSNQIFIGFEKVRLRWMTPDYTGKLFLRA